MGFFSSSKDDQQDQPVEPTDYNLQQPVSNDYDPQAAQAAQPNIDGVIPPAAGSPMPAMPRTPVSGFGPTSAPPVDDSGASYIMTDAPAQTDQQMSPAYSPTVGAPAPDPTPAADPVQDMSAPEPTIAEPAAVAPETPADMQQPQYAPEAPAEPQPEQSAEVSSIEPAYPPDPQPAQEPQPESEQAIPVAVNINPSPAAVPATDPQVGQDLGSIKQQALQQLSPLVSHLNQTPEERFNTTMMMLQATDDQSLVPVAYEAAQAITDEKTKAQALLDIVNEINYFTNTSRPQ